MMTMSLAQNMCAWRNLTFEVVVVSSKEGFQGQDHLQSQRGSWEYLHISRVSTIKPFH
jgi:hypothetical protein